jgi:hypothetical protein
MAMTSFDEWKNGTKEQDIHEMDVLGGLKSMGKFGRSAIKGLGSNIAGKISGFLGGKLQSTDATNLANEVLGLMGPTVLAKAEEDPNFVTDFAASIKSQLPMALMKLKQAANK